MNVSLVINKDELIHLTRNTRKA